MPLTYKQAGVDIDAGDALVERIKPLAAATRTAEVLAGVGGFAGLCAVPGDVEEPVLVSGTDGVGTKLKIAFATGVHDTIGIDLVGMCVNDVVTCGARPLFFLDYFATGKLDVGVAERVIAGIAAGCKETGCALLGGETAGFPGMYAPGEYDLAGFAVGVVARKRIVDGTRVEAGDVAIGLPSSGLHSNGYSLARKVVEAMKVSFGDRPGELGGATVGEALLAPTRLYARQARALVGDAKVDVRAMCHVTGSGLPGNMPRVLPEGLGLRIERGWSRAPIFDFIQRGGGIEDDEMRSTFNMGVGFVIVVPERDAARANDLLGASGEAPIALGRIVDVPRDRTFEERVELGRVIVLGVLASGGGTKIQAILDAIAAGKLEARVAVVVSNVAGAGALARARAAHVEAIVIEHGTFPEREAFDAALVAAFRERGVEVVVLAGFMRLVTSVLLDAFPWRVVNVHPALLPAFPGIHAQRQAFDYGVRITGCTVHFVDGGTDTGPVVAQAAVPVHDEDDEASVRARILAREHELLPKVLQWMAEGRVTVEPPSAPGRRARVRVRGISPALGWS